jgi:hypothetical protein
VVRCEGGVFVIQFLNHLNKAFYTDSELMMNNLAAANNVTKI